MGSRTPPNVPGPCPSPERANWLEWREQPAAQASCAWGAGSGLKVTCPCPQLSFCADGELGAAWLGPGLGAGPISGLRVRKAKALPAADASHPLCCAFLLARTQPLPDI